MIVTNGLRPQVRQAVFAFRRYEDDSLHYTEMKLCWPIPLSTISTVTEPGPEVIASKAPGTAWEHLGPR